MESKWGTLPPLPLTSGALSSRNNPPSDTLTLLEIISHWYSPKADNYVLWISMKYPDELVCPFSRGTLQSRLHCCECTATIQHVKTCRLLEEIKGGDGNDIVYINNHDPSSETVTFLCWLFWQKQDKTGRMATVVAVKMHSQEKAQLYQTSW